MEVELKIESLLTSGHPQFLGSCDIPVWLVLNFSGGCHDPENFDHLTVVRNYTVNNIALAPNVARQKMTLKRITAGCQHFIEQKIFSMVINMC